MKFDMSQFDSYREDNRREVKKAQGGLPTSLWETYSAFANCYGGVIILGVKENKDGSWYMTGLDNAAKLRKDFWDTINNKNKVSVNLLTDNDIEIFEENNGIIMVIHVPKAKREQKPVYINGDMFRGTFRRNWEGDYHCDRSEVLDLKIPFKLEGITRIDDTPVHKALREALANCLVNTDFYFPRGIVIRKDAESIVMENPGSIRTGKAQMLKGGISDPRNKVLMKMFNLIGIGERAGSGVPDIYSVWEQQGWKQPEVIEEYGPDRTILKLSLIKKVAIKNGDKKVAIKSGDKKKITKRTEQQLEYILEHMAPNQEYKTSELSEVIGLKESRTRMLLNELAMSGRIAVSGKNKGRRYKRI